MGNMDKLYRGGVPTQPDAKTLLEYYDVLKPGDEIPYADLESILGVSRKSTRFKTVTTVWRKMLMNNRGIVLAPKQGIGLFVTDDKDKLMLSNQRVKTAGTYLKHGADIARRIEHPEALPAEDRRRVDHIVSISVAFEGFRRLQGTKSYKPQFNISIEAPEVPAAPAE